MTDPSPAATATSLFGQGHACSQAVLAAFAPRFGLDHVTALKLAAPFGGGMGRLGRQCGAVSGALMVIGLYGGRVDPDDDAARDRNDALVGEFMTRFEDHFGSSVCSELTGVDMRDPAARSAAKESGTFDRVCPGCVERAAELVEELLAR